MHRCRSTGPLVLALIAFLNVPFAPVSAQQATAAAPAAAPRAGEVPLDPHVLTGVLPNGLRYFIRENAWPANRAELRLAINVGSVLEADDQLGLAHFLEHMAFNGTEHFPKQELVQYLRSIGMRFGADVNAYTGFDETVYMLQLPTDNPAYMQQGIAILGDWSHAQRLDPDEIEAERGVVVEEWRIRRGAGARMQDRHFPVLLEGSRYANRLPIGDVELLRTFPHEALTRFYRDWYRPDLMAVIAVGDFDKAEVERMIRERFSRMPAPAAPTQLPVIEIPQRAGTRVSIATDAEATSTSLTMFSLVPPRDHLTFAGYRDRTIERLYFAMLNARLGEIARKPDAPFVGAGVGRGYFVRTADAYTINAGVRDGGVETGLDAVLTEIERAARHGFTSTELERARANALNSRERLYAQREQRTSASRADELVRHFVNREDAAGTEIEHEMQMRILPAVTLDDINEMARTRPPASNRVILVNAPQKDGVTVPTQPQILAVIDAVARKAIDPYREIVVDVPLVPALPQPVAIVEERAFPEIGVTEWRLGNGARVVLKPTDFQTDQVMLSGMSPGGSSLVPDSLHLDAVFATAAAGVGGLGELSQTDLTRLLAGRSASANVSIGSRTEGISGASSRKDIETMFQLVYLRFTAPRRDPAAFAAFRQANQSMLANRGVSPQAEFADTINVTMAGYHPRARPITADAFDRIDLDRALGIYRDRFADASDFTFFIIGDFDIDSIRPHVQRYLGGLPSLNRTESGRDLGIRPPTGVVRKLVHTGAEPQSQTFLSFTGPFEFDPNERYLLASMGEVLQNRLLDRLREALGGTYSVSASAGAGREPPATYSVTINFGSAPERADELVDAVMEEIRMLQTQGPSAADVEKVVEAQRRARELNLKRNPYWLSNLTAAYQFGDDPRDILKLHERYELLTPDAVRAMAQRYLRLDNYVHITRLPALPRM
jgi:zinc protease